MDIHEYRLKRKLTQEELAELLDVSNVTVSKWESGHTQPSKRHLNKLKNISVQTELEVIPFRPIQYLGSKLKLLSSIDEIVKSVSQGHRFCDLFCGSGVVSNYMANSYTVISCDVQHYSTMLTSSLTQKSKLTVDDIEKIFTEVIEKLSLVNPSILALIRYEEDLVNKAAHGDEHPLVNFSTCASLYINDNNPSQLTNVDKQLQVLIEEVISLKEITSFQTLYLYGGIYFSYQQALLIDLLRQNAELLADPIDKNLIISSLLSACSEVANTVGKQFAQPMKLTNRDGSVKKLQIKRTIQNKNSNIINKTKKAFLNFLNAQKHLSPLNHNEVICDDVFNFLNEYDNKIDCFYADPPYTIDHYSRFYHVLETIALYDNPSLSYMNKKGERVLMNGLYRTDRHQSEFCVPSLAPAAFDKLFSGCSNFNAPLIVSYSPFNKSNNERSRLLTESELESLARKYYEKVTFIKDGEHKHRKLHSNKSNVETIKHSEMFMICEISK